MCGLPVSSRKISDVSYVNLPWTRSYGFSPAKFLNFAWVYRVLLKLITSLGKVSIAIFRVNVL